MIVETVGRALRLHTEAIYMGKRQRRVVAARDAAIWLAKRWTLLSFNELAAQFGMARSSVVAADKRMQGLLMARRAA